MESARTDDFKALSKQTRIKSCQIQVVNKIVVLKIHAQYASMFVKTDDLACIVVHERKILVA